MVPRLSFDITASDLLRAACYSFRKNSASFRKNSALAPTLPLDAPRQREALLTLSVRSAMDLLLSALELPAGSEVLLSEVTVPHMATIIAAHGLVPVGLPIDPRTLAVDVDQVEQRATDKTRLLLVAPLFGTRMPLEELARLSSERGWLLVEDAAQALMAPPLADLSPTRHPAADVSLYSFGPIKTATALGGGLALVRDDSLRERMKAIAESWPQQSRWDYLARVCKIAILKLLSQRPLFTLLVAAIRFVGGDADRWVGGSARGFPDARLLEFLRRQPSAALQAMIVRRLAHLPALQHSLEERARRGEEFAQQLGEVAFVAGCDNPTHTYWAFAVVCRDPQQTLTKLREAGFDASQHSGLTVVGESPTQKNAASWFGRVLFVPQGKQVRQNELARAAEIIRSVE